MKIISVCHYVDSNTLEVTWVEELFDLHGNSIGYERVKCHAYSSDQRAEFIADTELPEYADLAGWPT